MAELVDDAGIFVGDVAEAFYDMEFAVLRNPDRLPYAQAEMSRAMQRAIDSRPPPPNAARERKRRT